jgi:hypothetical protein
MLVIYTQEITVGDKVFHTTTEERLECLWEWFWSCCNCNTHALLSTFQFSSSQEKRSSFSSTFYDRASYNASGTPPDALDHYAIMYV